uniref:Fibroblast growth factor binding protein 1b n=1 Tax=Knipowitschia caucasica TaxID=637954 RepID=A0AAV2LK66_KNICA
MLGVVVTIGGSAFGREERACRAVRVRKSHVLDQALLTTGPNSPPPFNCQCLLCAADMLVLRSAFPWIVVSILALLSLCSGARDRPRSKGVTRAPRGSGEASSRGKFNLKNGMQCSWVTKDVSRGVKMTVKCQDPQARVTGGVTDVECAYNAKPQSCPGYQSNPKAYYKQVSRALKKLQGGLCQDERALVKVGMCKRAPRDAHFKLDRSTSVFAAQSGVDPSPHPKNPSTISTTTRRSATPTPPAGVDRVTPTDCKRRADHRTVAQEYCNSSWASVCSFFFSMLQSEDC